MNKIHLLFGLLLIAGAANGQDSLMVTDQAKSSAVVSRLTRELNLNTTQQNQVALVMQNRWNTIQEWKASNQVIDWQSINEGTVSELRKIFTIQQYGLFTTLREQTKKQKDAFKQQNSGYQRSGIGLELDF